MRLINTDTLQLEEFYEADIPQYAILSHRWEAEEVSYQDMVLQKGRRRKGYAKILRCCDQAKSNGLKYAWIDTCCIDKSSSSELSEAINSMFTWYSHSRICYAYLSDVDDGDDLERSQWFGRGWTLQELIAPHFVVFFSRLWKAFGLKNAPQSDFDTKVYGSHHELPDLARRLSVKTRIPEAVLTEERHAESCSIAERMSWAANRKTTRIEDRAYCLLGLFDINMALLYGEGNKAFYRLQEEIIKQSDDHSIFAWTDESEPHPYQLFSFSFKQVRSTTVHRLHGLLAGEPKSFATSDLSTQLSLTTPRPGLSGANESFTITNRGLSIKLSLIQWTSDIYLALLNCTTGTPTSISQVPILAIFLQRLNTAGADEQYARVRPSQIVSLPPDMDLSKWQMQPKRINIRGQDRLSPRVHYGISVRAKLTDFLEFGGPEQQYIKFGRPQQRYVVEEMHVASRNPYLQRGSYVEASALPNSTPVIIRVNIVHPRELRPIFQIHLDDVCKPYFTISGFQSQGQAKLPPWAWENSGEHLTGWHQAFTFSSLMKNDTASRLIYRHNRNSVCLCEEGFIVNNFDPSRSVWEDEWLLRFEEIDNLRNDQPVAEGTGVNAFVYRKGWPTKAPGGEKRVVPPVQLFHFTDQVDIVHSDRTGHFYAPNPLLAWSHDTIGKSTYDDGFVRVVPGDWLNVTPELEGERTVGRLPLTPDIVSNAVRPAVEASGPEYTEALPSPALN